MEYLFILGKTKELSVLEIEKVLELEKISHEVISISQHAVLIKTTVELDSVKLLGILGGTVKIAKIFSTTEGAILPLKEITSYLTKFKPRIIFGLSWYGQDNETNHFYDLKQWTKEIKNKLQKEDFSVRYVLPKDANELSSVVVDKQKLCEIIVFQTKEQIVLAQTLAVQDFEDWNKRDYQRPVVAPDKGMLPPKVARMMVNIVRQQDALILDPFCGTGTILAEALSMGLKVIGSDISKAAIDMAQKDLTWLCSTYNLPQNFKLYQLDASHISQTFAANSIDLIVTEPYLGPLFEVGPNVKVKGGKTITPGFILRIIDGLERMYLGSLKDWQKILKETGKVVIVLPSFNLDRKEYFVKKVIDNCEKLGYSIEVGPLPYSRPLAIVKRNIYILRKNSAN